MNLKSLFSALSSPDGKLTKAGTAKVLGHKTYVISSSKGGAMYVAATGKPYPLEFKNGGGSSSGSVTFTNWNKPFAVPAPSGAIDLDKLNSGS
jgi:hypothetical protein